MHILLKRSNHVSSTFIVAAIIAFKPSENRCDRSQCGRMWTEVLFKKALLPFLPRFPPSTSVTAKGCTTTHWALIEHSLRASRCICRLHAKDIFAALIRSSGGTCVNGGGCRFINSKSSSRPELNRAAFPPAASTFQMFSTHPKWRWKRDTLREKWNELKERSLSPRK